MAHPALALALWLAAIGLVVWALCAGAPRRVRGADEGRWGAAETAYLVVLTLGALAARAIANGTIPFGLTGDEGGAGLAAIDVVEGRFDNPFVAGWFAFPGLHQIVQSWFLAAGGRTYAALRLPSALAGAATIPALYFMARPMFGRGAAAIAAAFLAGLPLHVHFSRIGLNNIWDPLFAALTFGAVWRAWEREDRRWFVAAGTLLGFAQYFYVSARLIPLVLAAWLALHAVTDPRAVRARARGLLALALSAAAVVLPLALFYARHVDQFMAPLRRSSLRSLGWLARDAQATHQPEWLILLKNFVTACLAYTSRPLQAWWYWGTPVLLGGAATLFLAAVAAALTRPKDPRAWLLGLWLAGIAAGAAQSDFTPAGQRYVFATPAAVLVAAVPLAAAGAWLARRWPHRRGVVLAGTAAVAALVVAADLTFYFRTYRRDQGLFDENTQTATLLATHLASYPARSSLYFFGAPKLVTRGFATFPFLAPQVATHDVDEPITAAPEIARGALTAFAFLPHRRGELALVEQRYPGGTERSFLSPRSSAHELVVLYELPAR